MFADAQTKATNSSSSLQACAVRALARAAPWDPHAGQKREPELVAQVTSQLKGLCSVLTLVAKATQGSQGSTAYYQASQPDSRSISSGGEEALQRRGSCRRPTTR